MAGRAGRAGLDDRGEVVLLAHRKVSRTVVEALLTGHLTAAESCLDAGKRGGSRVVVRSACSPPPLNMAALGWLGGAAKHSLLRQHTAAASPKLEEQQRRLGSSRPSPPEHLRSSSLPPPPAPRPCSLPGMKRALLEAVAIGAVRTPQNVQCYIQCTLLSSMHGTRPVTEATKAALVWLGREAKMLAWGPQQDAGGKDAPGAPGAGPSPEAWSATKLGAAVVASGLDPDEIEGVRRDMKTSNTCLNLDSVLQSMYLIVPPAAVDTSLKALLQRQGVWQRFHLVLESLLVREERLPPARAACCRPLGGLAACLTAPQGAAAARVQARYLGGECDERAGLHALPSCAGGTPHAPAPADADGLHLQPGPGRAGGQV